MAFFNSYERIVVLALDSVSWDLLLPFTADSTMPTLSALLKSSHYGILNSTQPPHAASAWTTFLTGKTAGQHGIIDFVSFDPTRQRFRSRDSSEQRADTIFSILSTSQVSCGSIFLPRCFPPYPLHDGYMVSGFETPNSACTFAKPSEIHQEVLSVSPQMHFNFSDEWEDDKEDAAFARNIERAMDSVDLLERVTIHFQRERPVKVQISYLQATGVLLHKARRWCDPKTAVENEFRREQIKKFFRRVDQLINRVLGVHSSSSTSGRFRLGGTVDKTLRVIVSEHGQSIRKGQIFVNNLLKDWGYLKPLNPLHRAANRLRMLTLSAEQRRIKRREIPLDWSRTQAYMAQVCVYGFVYINLRGREPQGIVSPDDFEKVRDELISKFKAAKIPSTDHPLFVDAIKGEVLYARKKELNLPDIILIPADGYSPRKKIIRGVSVHVTPNAIGGVNHGEGIYLFQGNGIAPSGTKDSNSGTGARAGIQDIAPTLLAALGEPIPADMTGKAMKHLFQQTPKT